MPPKRAKFLTYGEDATCAETKKFIEDAGVMLEIRDIVQQPLSYDEVDRLIKHMDPSHFLNYMSPSYEKHGLDEKMPDRPTLIGLIVEDPTLLRRPIIQSSRLVTVGCDKKNIALMLQIGMNGNKDDDERESDRHNRRANRGQNAKQPTAAR